VNLRNLADPTSGSHVLKPSDDSVEKENTAHTLKADEASRKQAEERIRKQAEEKVKKQQLSPRGGGGDASATTKLAVVSIQNIDELRSKVQLLLDRATEKGWILLNYTKPTELFVQASEIGGTVSTLLSKLEDNQIQYVLLRLSPLPVPKDIFLVWVGPKVSKIEQGKKSEHLQDMKSILGPAHMEVTAYTKNNFNEGKIREIADPSSGTHILKD
jgi:hypothetical protein